MNLLIILIQNQGIIKDEASQNTMFASKIVMKQSLENISKTLLPHTLEPNYKRVHEAAHLKRAKMKAFV